MKFADIMELAISSNSDGVGIVEATNKLRLFTTELDLAVNTFSTGGIREEARAYGKESPENMRLVCFAWTAALASAYEKGRGYYDGRNQVSAERCCKFWREFHRTELLINYVNLKHFMNIRDYLDRYTMQYMHRTLIQTATQVLWEGMMQAIGGTEIEEVLKRVCDNEDSYFTRMPMV